jgi:hypothetical protein
MKSFAEAFVLKERKDRWARLLCERPNNIFKESSKLFNHLNHNYIEQNDSLINIAPYDNVGVFYDFCDEPKCITFKEAIEEGHGHNAMFSINPGKLAVYFLQEGWNFVCKR